MIDIDDFNKLRERQARNISRLRTATWTAIGILLLANALQALGLV
ncbi:hypothetical protein [Cupriavidus nantongensis]|nr:hypothetical protein [Cupriavidus nantongensis]